METIDDPSRQGILYLIPSPLGENAPMEVLPLTIRKIIEDINHYIVENENKYQKEAVLLAKNILKEKNVG